MREPPRPDPGVWPHLRAAFVVFHVVAILILSTPSTGAALKRSAWENPTVQAEFAAWAPRFHLTTAALSDRLWDVAVAWNAARESLCAPVRPYARITGLSQSWQMFVAPHTFPTRLRLEETRRAPGVGGALSDEDADWDVLFEERSPDHTWLASTLSVERLRASIFRWGWPSYGTSYKSACRALAARRFAEEPGITGFRCRFTRARTRSAAEVTAGTPEQRESLPPVVVGRP